MLQEKGEKVWKMWCAYWSPAEQTHLKNAFFTTENNGKLKCQNALTAITPSALFKALAKAGKREEREENSVNYGFFFLEISDQSDVLVGQWWPTKQP